MSQRPFSHAEIDRKLELWTSLAHLYLDTDIGLWHQSIANNVKKSDFSLSEAEDILRWEVRPAFYGNLLDVAGEWRVWPEEQVLALVQRARQKPPYFMKPVFRRIFANSFIPDSDWKAVVNLVNAQSEKEP